jgi:hypothetical protein
MKPIPLAQFLMEFGNKAPPAASTEPHYKVRQQAAQVATTVVHDETPRMIEEARTRGVEEGRAAVLAEMHAKLDEMQRFYEQQRDLERCTWAAREAAQFAAQLAEGLDAIEAAIAESTANILKPFLKGEIHRQAITSLCAALDVIVKQDQALAIEVSGPEDILQLLRERLSSTNATAVFTPDDTVEVRVRVGQTILETQLAAWMAKLEEISK